MFQESSAMDTLQLRDLAAGALQHYRTTPTLVADVLREAILNGILTPGQPLRQDEIAEQFKLSRSPVREALRQLEGEGLVKFYPHRGAMVADFALSELWELCEIRIPLETLAIRQAMAHLTAPDLQRAETIIAAGDAMTEEDARKLWGTNNWQFHATLYAPAQRPRLFGIIKNLHAHFDRYVRVYFAVTHLTERAQREHREILAACRERDTERAAFLIERDIASVGEMLTKVLGWDGEMITRSPAAPPPLRAADGRHG